MTFYVHGLNAFEVLDINKVLKKDGVEKTASINAAHTYDEQEGHEQEKHERQKRQIYKQHVAQVYESVGALPQAERAVFAERIMIPSVVTLTEESTVDDALFLFRTKKIRHLPIISLSGVLIGIVSERDILHHLSGVSENYQHQKPRSSQEKVTTFMRSPVLTASTDTDIRYIARLFVERRIGALPIVSDSKLEGIITRSDVLTAVMRHFVLELWA